ncbi:MAG: TrwB bind protein [Candidatus Berkelbacteria bacterium]|nr:TrwB bind protein [Candidatus Berkelbacteria bacterium]
MPIGSDLFNLAVTFGFLLFILIISYIIYSLYRSNKLRHELKRVKSLSIFQISIPRQITAKQNEPPKDFKETIGVAEQFFSSLGNLYETGLEKKIYGLQNQVTLEIISLDGKLEFFCIVPKDIESIIEKQINSFWPTAQIKKSPAPNIFKFKQGAMVASNFKLNKKFILPIKTYKYLESDPLNALTNALSKLGPDAGAAIQIIVKPISDDWRRVAGISAHKIQKGKSFVTEKWYMKIFGFVFEILSGIFHGSKSDDTNQTVSPNFKQPVQLTPMQEQLLKFLNEKASKTGLATNIRVVATSKTHEEAVLNIKNISTAFGQFATPELNGFKTKVEGSEVVRDYILRRFTGKGMILNSDT